MCPGHFSTRIRLSMKLVPEFRHGLLLRPGCLVIDSSVTLGCSLEHMS